MCYNNQTRIPFRYLRVTMKTDHVLSFDRIGLAGQAARTGM
jgi:hypothetical protein